MGHSLLNRIRGDLHVTGEEEWLKGYCDATKPGLCSDGVQQDSTPSAPRVGADEQVTPRDDPRFKNGFLC